VEAIKATKLGSCEETSCILLGLERPHVTLSCSNDRNQMLYQRAKGDSWEVIWYLSNQISVWEFFNLLFLMWVFTVCVFTAYTLKENERGCANEKNYAANQQEQWQAAAVTSQRKQLDISSHPQCNIWWQFTIQAQRYKQLWQRNKKTRKEWQQRVSQRWNFSSLLPQQDPQVPKRASHLRES